MSLPDAASLEGFSLAELRGGGRLVGEVRRLHSDNAALQAGVGAQQATIVALRAENQALLSAEMVRYRRERWVLPSGETVTADLPCPTTPGSSGGGTHALCWARPARVTAMRSIVGRQVEGHPERLVHKRVPATPEQRRAVEGTRALIWRLCADLKAWRRDPCPRRRGAAGAL